MLQISHEYIGEPPPLSWENPDPAPEGTYGRANPLPQENLDPAPEGAYGSLLGEVSASVRWCWETGSAPNGA